MTRQRTPMTSPQARPGFFAELARSARVAWRLMRDPRVATVTKLVVPALAAVYLLSPIDILPDVFPVLGQLDDLALLALGVKLFIELCPPEIVRQHQMDIAGATSQRQPDSAEGEIVDAEYRIIE